MTIRTKNRARAWHKWLMLIVGIQMSLWAFSGAYFAFMDIHFIHGDSLVKKEASYLEADNFQFPIAELYQRYPGLESVQLGQIAGHDVYRIVQQGKTRLIHPVTGRPLATMGQAQAIAVARYHYTGAGEVRQATLLTETAPSELSPRHLPAWRVDFEDVGNTSLYISKDKGTLVTKRHDFWRWFDAFWYLHIMDYDDGENLNNWLLRLAALLALCGAITGLVLTWQRLAPKREASQ